MRYVLFPDYVRSSKDGEYHFVTPHQLLDLYNIDDDVTVDDCLVIKHHQPPKMHRAQNGDIELRPRYNGNYTVPKPHGEK